MAHMKTLGTARKTTGGKARKKRLGTPPARKTLAKRPRVAPISSCEMPSEAETNAQAEAEARRESGVWRPEFRVDGQPLPEDISLLKDFSVTDLRTGLSQHFASVGSYATALMDWYESSMKSLIKEKQGLISKCNQALKERDLALEELNNFGAELKEVQNDLAKSQAEFEFGKKVWAAERIALTDTLERTKLDDKLKGEKKLQNAYCRGYLDGWFEDPHAYIVPIPDE